jgi:Flp pilus assembly protein TadB
MKWLMNDDFDRYDIVISIISGLIMVGVLLLGAPLWTLVLIVMVCCTISLYRHLPLPPRRIKHG